jgi:ankyrin repeat protein
MEYGEHLAIVKILLENGADPNAKDNDNLAPLHKAAIGGTLAVVRALLKFGANPNARDKHDQASLNVAKTKNMRIILLEGRKNKRQDLS